MNYLECFLFLKRVYKGGGNGCLVNGSSLSFQFRNTAKIFDRSIPKCFFGHCKSVL